MLQMLLQFTNICVTLHEIMYNRAGDAEILRQLSIIKSDINQLKDETRLSAISEDPNTGSPLRVQNGLPLNGVHCSDRVLGNTMYSVEDFVDDSVSTVYDRSASSAEVSDTLGRGNPPTNIVETSKSIN